MIERDEHVRINEFFERLHEQDRSPDFRDLWPREDRSRRVPGRLVPVAATLLLAVAGGWLFVTGWQRPPVDLTAAEALALADSLSTWQGPLDFLLETPGSEYLTTVPVFGFEATEIDADGNGQEIRQ